MIEPLLRRFLENKQRKKVVIILTLLTLLAVAWPAVDEYIAAADRAQTAKQDLQQAQQDVEALPTLSQTLKRKRNLLGKLEAKSVTGPAAQSLRGELVALVRRTGCMMRSIRLNTPSSRVWMEEDDPISGKARSDDGEETPFELITRQMSVSITGPMNGIHEFLEGVHRIDKLIHTQQVSMRRSETDKDQTVLELDILLFDLARIEEN